jgi:hypothetical protein
MDSEVYKTDSKNVFSNFGIANTFLLFLFPVETPATIYRTHSTHSHGLKLSGGFTLIARLMRRRRLRRLRTIGSQ